TWHVNPSTRPYEAGAGRSEAWTLTCEAPGGEVLERQSIVVGRGQTASLDLACGDPSRTSTAPVVSRTPADAGSETFDRLLEQNAPVAAPRGARIVLGRVLSVR